MDQRPSGIAAVQPAFRSIEKCALAPWLSALVIAIAAAAIYIHFTDWPPGTQPDELKKARFILSGKQDFHHPVLPLQISRIANIFLDYTQANDTLKLGRIVSGIFGGLTVFATFVLGRMVLAPGTAVAAALGVAVTPLVAIHAAFLKEDIYLTAAAIFGLAALLALVDRPTKARALAVGVAFGVAISAKLVGVLLLAYAIVMMLVASQGPRLTRALLSGIALMAAVATFVVINASALLDYETVRAALYREVGKAAGGGDDVSLPIWLTWGVMHLRDHLIPWLGLPLVSIGLAGLTVPLFSKRHRKPLAIIAAAALLWYLGHELSPLKGPRYMLPEAPMLIVLGAAFIETIVRWRSARWMPVAASAVLLLAAAPAAYNSYRILTSNQHDPRRVMPKIIAMLGQQLQVDPYVLYDSRQDERINRGIDRSRPLAVLATSNFYYDRFERYGNHPSQSDEARDKYNFYFNLAFRHPYLELSTGWRSYRYVNPVIRIVALDDDIDRLLKAGEAVIKLDPYVEVEIGP